jgi:hypothetical protein
MDLMDRCELGLGMHSGDGKSAVAGDRFRIVVAAEADVETGACTDGDSAAATEEGVRKPAKTDGPDGLNAAQSGFRMMMSSSA